MQNFSRTGGKQVKDTNNITNIVTSRAYRPCRNITGFACIDRTVEIPLQRCHRNMFLRDLSRDSLRILHLGDVSRDVCRNPLLKDASKDDCRDTTIEPSL